MLFVQEEDGKGNTYTILTMSVEFIWHLFTSNCFYPMVIDYRNISRDMELFYLKFLYLLHDLTNWNFLDPMFRTNSTQCGITNICLIQDLTK